MENRQRIGAQLKMWITKVLKEDVGVSKVCLAFFLKKTENLDNCMRKVLCYFMLELVDSKAILFDDEIFDICSDLRYIYTGEQRYGEAAKALARIPLQVLDQYSDNTKLQFYLEIARYHMFDKNIVEAEVYLNRAKPHHSITDDGYLKIHYQDLQAILLALKKKFIESARKFFDAGIQFYELYESPGGHESRVSSIDRLAQFNLQFAVLAATLAPAGQQRSELILSLCQNRRLQKLPCFPTLQKICQDRLVTRVELLKFERSLAAGQTAVLPNWCTSTELEQAVTEHNMMWASKQHTSIHLQELAWLLEIPRNRVESCLARMVKAGLIWSSTSRSVVQFNSAKSNSKKDKDDSDGKKEVGTRWYKMFSSLENSKRESVGEKAEEVEGVAAAGADSLKVCSSCRSAAGEAGQARLFICSGCWSAYYCNTKCQRADWGRHKQFCREKRAEKDAKKKADNERTVVEEKEF